VKYFHVTLDGDQIAIGTKDPWMFACADPQAIAV
jgi:hypothetical protein